MFVQGLAKGQSGLMVAAVALMLAVPLSQIPDFTVKYVTASSFADMEVNSMRYQSVAHSYKFTSQGVNNKVNYTEAKNDIASTGPVECDLINSEYQPDEYNVSFAGDLSGTTFTNEGCTANFKQVGSDPNIIYPSIPFYETKDGDVNRVISTVVP